MLRNRKRLQLKSTAIVSRVLISDLYFVVEDKRIIFLTGQINDNVASFIKEFIVEVPEDMPYEAGGYIQIEIPKCEVDYSNIDITSHPDEHPDNPEKFKPNNQTI